MKSSDTFKLDPFAQGTWWTFKCLIVAAAVVLGQITGHLHVLCIAVIIFFVLWQGVIPFFGLAIELTRDIRLCRQDKRDLQQISIEDAQHLTTLDTRDSGSLFKIVVAVQVHQGRISKSEALPRMLNVSRREWENTLTPIQAAAEQAPVLGLGGSLLGMLQGIDKLAMAMIVGQADQAAAFGQMFQGISTMISTTLAGCGGALLLIGLASIASTAVEKHLADLQLMGELMLGAESLPESKPGDDDLYTLFDTVKSEVS